MGDFRLRRFWEWGLDWALRVVMRGVVMREMKALVRVVLVDVVVRGGISLPDVCQRVVATIMATTQLKSRTLRMIWSMLPNTPVDARCITIIIVQPRARAKQLSTTTSPIYQVRRVL